MTATTAKKSKQNFKKNGCAESRMKAILGWALVVVLLLGCAPANTQELPTLSIQTPDGEVSIALEVSSTPEERSKGLMFRDYLEEGSGMWFEFEKPEMHGFWMKNTLIPLDMVFVSENLTIVDIIRADPCVADPCPVYSPKAAARYVLEINQNASEAYHFLEGQKIRLPGFEKYPG